MRYIPSRNFNVSVIIYVKEDTSVKYIEEITAGYKRTGCEVILLFDNGRMGVKIAGWVEQQFEINFRSIAIDPPVVSDPVVFSKMIERVCNRKYLLIIPFLCTPAVDLLPVLIKQYLLLKPSAICQRFLFDGKKANKIGDSLLQSLSAVMLFTEKKSLLNALRELPFGNIHIEHILAGMDKKSPLFLSLVKGVSKIQYSFPAEYLKNEQLPPGGYKAISSYEERKSNKLLEKYLSGFEAFQICKPNLNNVHLKVVALVPVKNERKNIAGLLDNLRGKCDGVIFLDDGSDDDSYEEIADELVLIKVRKGRSVRFLDLDNRNILLNILCFLKVEWAYFIDADERFDQRFSDIYALTSLEGIDTIGFSFVNIWDEDCCYRVDIPDLGLQKEGIIFRWRMFRIYGRMQIANKSNLHFISVPYVELDKAFKAPVLLLHYGMYDSSIRRRKHELYRSEDKLVQADPGMYDFYLNETVKLANVQEIKLENLVLQK